MSEHALVIGEALVDVVRSTDGATAAHPGGSPANVALGLGRLGRTVQLLTSLGDDDNGRLVRDHLLASGVDLAGGTPAAFTSVATAYLDAAGVATYEFDLTWSLANDAVTAPSPLVVHTGSIAAVLEPGGSTVKHLLREARHYATITYDPNARPSLMGNPADALTRIETIVALSDVVKVSDEDLAWLHPGLEPFAVARRWIDLGAAVVIVTLGSEGSVAVTAHATVTISAVAVTVADTVGAGDSFMSGLIDGLWDAGLLGATHREELANAPAQVWESVLHRCAHIAGITVSRAGANPPTAAELDVP